MKNKKALGTANLDTDNQHLTVFSHHFSENQMHRWREWALLVNFFNKHRVPTLLDEKNPEVFQSNIRIFEVLSVVVCSRNIKNTRRSSLSFTIHSFVIWINLYAIQPLQCQNQRKSTYHTKNSRSNIKSQEFSRLTNFQFFQVSGNPVTVLIVLLYGLKPTALISNYQESTNLYQSKFTWPFIHPFHHAIS